MNLFTPIIGISLVAISCALSENLKVVRFSYAPMREKVHLSSTSVLSVKESLNLIVAEGRKQDPDTFNKVQNIFVGGGLAMLASEFKETEVTLAGYLGTFEDVEWRFHDGDLIVTRKDTHRDHVVFSGLSHKLLNDHKFISNPKLWIESNGISLNSAEKARISPDRKSLIVEVAGYKIPEIERVLLLKEKGERKKGESHTVSPSTPKTP